MRPASKRVKEGNGVNGPTLRRDLTTQKRADRTDRMWRPQPRLVGRS